MCTPPLAASWPRTTRWASTRHGCWRERYLKRSWFFFQTLDEARLEADRLAIAGKLDEAEDLLSQSRHLDDSRALRHLGRAGKILGPLGLGLGVYNDYQEGETTAQIAVSQGVSTGLGVAAGGGASALTGVDSLFENGPEVGAAAEAGVEALADTGEAIADGVSSVADTVGGWFS